MNLAGRRLGSAGGRTDQRAPTGDHARERRDRHREPANHRGRQLPDLGLPEDERGRRTRLPAESEGVEDRAVPVPGVLPERAGDPARLGGDMKVVGLGASFAELSEDAASTAT